VFGSVVEYGDGLHHRMNVDPQKSTDHRLPGQRVAVFVALLDDETETARQANVAEASIAPEGVTNLAPRRRLTQMLMAFDHSPLPAWSVKAPVNTVEPSSTWSTQVIAPV
jgi:hypothetical protein